MQGCTEVLMSEVQEVLEQNRSNHPLTCFAPDLAGLGGYLQRKGGGGEDLREQAVEQGVRQPLL